MDFRWGWTGVARWRRGKGLERLLDFAGDCQFSWDRRRTAPSPPRLVPSPLESGQGQTANTPLPRPRTKRPVREGKGRGPACHGVGGVAVAGAGAVWGGGSGGKARPPATCPRGGWKLGTMPKRSAIFG